MQQWTLERSSESPESTGRLSLLQRDAKVFRPDTRHSRRSGRAAPQTRSSGSSFTAEPLSLPSDHKHHHNNQSEERWEEEEGRSSVPQRLSRHIPQRVGIDMAVSSFNLIASPACLSQPSVGSPRGVGVSYGRGSNYGSSNTVSGAMIVAGHNSTSGSIAGPAAASNPPATHSTTVVTAAAAGIGGTSITPSGSTLSPTPASSGLTSFSESMVSDDSSYMTSLYNDVLANNLIGHRTGGASAPAGSGGDGRGAVGGFIYGRSTPTVGGPHPGGGGVVTSVDDVEDGRRVGEAGSEERGSGRRTHADSAVAAATARRGFGGEVLRFADTNSSEGTPRSFGAASPIDAPAVRVTTYTTKGARQASASSGAGLASALPRVRSRAFYTSGGSGSRGVSGPRVFNTTPERVLDAPQFPTDATQLLDWGSNNAIAIGMGQSLYSWSGDSGQAAKMVDLDNAARIRCVQWLHRCSCVALSVQEGTTAIYDCRTSDFLRTVRLPSGLEVTGLSVKGPVMAVASDSPHGTTCAYDLRAKDALIAVYEGHCGGIASLNYCAAEPFYLATGGHDGSVRVWDARRASTPRYAFDGVHQGSVNVVKWDPQKRSRLFTGGEDGVLCLMDTHAPKRTIEMDHNTDEEGAGVGCSNTQEHLAQYITRAVNTLFPISGLACHGTSGEVVTAHKLKGQLQLRKTSSFHLLSTFTALHCDAALSCLTMAPDKESVCAAQGDDTLKFWRVFDNSAARSGERGGATQANRAEWNVSHQDPGESLDEALR
jgi:WD40 repeat protein